MPWQCGKCGAFASRGSVTFDEKGSVVSECCSYCKPGNFDTPFRMPTDNRIYSGPQAFPHLYKRDQNDVFQAKDELIADTAAAWDEGPTERARQYKLKTRRTEPLTAEETASARHWGTEVVADVMRKGGAAAVAALLNSK